MCQLFLLCKFQIIGQLHYLNITVVLSKGRAPKDPFLLAKRTDCDSLRAGFAGCSLARRCGGSLRLRPSGSAQNDIQGKTAQ